VLKKGIHARGCEDTTKIEHPLSLNKYKAITTPQIQNPVLTGLTAGLGFGWNEKMWHITHPLCDMTYFL
jgi:hypothetical protein